MMSALPAAVEISAGELGRLAGLPSWLVMIVVAASLVLGLVKAIVPQDSGDRLNLLLAIRGCRTRPEISPGITVTGHVMDHEGPDAQRERDSTVGNPHGTRGIRP